MGIQRSMNGFSIVEMIVAIAVIGILLAVTVVAYTTYFQRSDKATTDATIQQVKLKLNQYFRDNNSFPVSSSGINTYLNSVSESTLATKFNSVIAGGGTYVATPASCDNSIANKCTGYTITVPATYWGGSGSPITVTP